MITGWNIPKQTFNNHNIWYTELNSGFLEEVFKLFFFFVSFSFIIWYGHEGLKNDLTEVICHQQYVPNETSYNDILR